MKRFLIAVLALAASTAALCGCNDGQTGGGQNLNDGNDTRIIREDENTPPDGQERGKEMPFRHGPHGRGKHFFRDGEHKKGAPHNRHNCPNCGENDPSDGQTDKKPD